MNIGVAMCAQRVSIISQWAVKCCRSLVQVMNIGVAMSAQRVSIISQWAVKCCRSLVQVMNIGVSMCAGMRVKLISMCYTDIDYATSFLINIGASV